MNKQSQAAFLKRVAKMKSERNRTIAARRYLEEFGNPFHSPELFDDAIWSMALNFTPADKHQHDSAKIYGMTHVLRCYFGGSAVGQPANVIAEKLAEFGIVGWDWLPNELQDPQNLYWSALDCAVFRRPEQLMEPRDVERAAVGLPPHSKTPKPRMKVIHPKMNNPKNFLNPVPVPKYKDKTLRVMQDYESEVDPDYLAAEPILSHADNARTPEGYALYVSFMCRRRPEFYGYVAATRLGDAFVELVCVADEVPDSDDFTWDISSLIHTSKYFTPEPEMVADWHAYCVRQYPGLRYYMYGEKKADDAQPAIVIPSVSDDAVLTFGDLDLMDVFAYQDEQRRMLYALKVGKRKAITGIQLDERHNICNLTRLPRHNELHKQAFAADAQVRRVVA